jgi:lysophospholipase L1-like esterase
MVDDDVEGHPGFRIDQVAEAAENALPFLPNLVIMHVGTNDAVQDYELDTAAERFGALIDRVLSAIPGVVVLVSTIIVNLNAGFEANIETINSQIPAMVAERANAGKYVYLVDMHDGYITTSDIHTSDKTHPTDGKLNPVPLSNA